MKQRDIWKLLESSLDTKILRCEAFDGSNSRFQVLAEGFAPLFCKIDSTKTGALPAEADGLQALRTHVLVPETFFVSERILIVEQIHSKLAGQGFGRKMGEALVDLHKKRGPIGWHQDNFIGKSRQWNLCDEGISWAEFYWDYRLQPQLLALRNLGFAQRGDWIARLEDATRQTLESVTEPASLLHGDLWSGNVLCDDEDEVVFIDPAVSYGHREMDFALIPIFGGFSREFFQSYDKLWPMETGAEKRSQFYQLYHLLNHAQIFGTSYWKQAWELIQKLTQSPKSAHVKSSASDGSGADGVPGRAPKDA